MRLFLYRKFSESRIYTYKLEKRKNFKYIYYPYNLKNALT